MPITHEKEKFDQNIFCQKNFYVEKHWKNWGKVEKKFKDIFEKKTP